MQIKRPKEEMRRKSRQEEKRVEGSAQDGKIRMKNRAGQDRKGPDRLVPSYGTH